jgi:hypothetical protein
MEALQMMIKPTVGIFTTLTDEHGENFDSHAHIAAQKAVLFRECDVVVHSADNDGIAQALQACDAKKMIWSELDESQKQTTVALVEYEVEPFDALELAEEETATILDIGNCFGDEERDQAVGEFYLEYLLDMEYFGKVPEFFRTYFDAEAFGRDLRLNGGDGFWSGIYNRWVDYPQGGYKNRLWYDWVVKERKK